MSGESYTRWRSGEGSDEEEEEDPSSERLRFARGRTPSRVATGGGGAVTIITSPSSAATSSVVSLAAQARVICVLILVCVLCLVLGVWVGWTWGRHTTSNSSTFHNLNLVIPVPESGRYNLTHRLLHNLQPQLLKKYIRQVSKTPKDKLRSYVKNTWTSLGLDTSTTSFTVYVNRPDRDKPHQVEVEYNSGESEVLYGNSSHHNSSALSLGASSGSGSVSGVAVYGHYGRREDLATLQSLKITLRGAILILRQGKIHAGAKIRNAQQAGAAAVVFYPDPQDFRGPGHGGGTYPEGNGLPDDGVVWESLSTLPGDPQTPHLPSVDQIYKQKNASTPASSLPALTVTMEAAGRLLRLMAGPEVPKKWRGDLPLPYRLGGMWLPDADVNNLTLTVNNVRVRQNITNIHATLPATDETKVVMIGSSPRVGLAALLALSEAVAQTFLPPRGPLGRKLVFSLWDGTEDGLLGSTEFSQLYSWWVEGSVIAYLGLDSVLRGTGSLKVKSSPTLREAIREAALMVDWPLGVEGVTVRDGWRLSDPPGATDVRFSCLGSGSDYVSFAAQHGVPAAHFTGMGKNGEATYSLQYSQYDTYQAYTTLLDPTLEWTHMISNLVGAVAGVLAATTEAPPLLLSELSGDLYNAWTHFTTLHSDTLARADYGFNGIINAIEAEIVTVQERLSLLDEWYRARPYYLRALVPHHSATKPQDHSSQIERRLWWFRNLERSLLGPRGIARRFTNNVAVGPDPENPLVALHFPHVTQAITGALQKRVPWETVHQELSYVLAVLTSYRQLFPSDFPSEPNYETD